MGEGDWEVYPLPAGWERNVMFMDEMKHFIAIVRGEIESLCPLEDGIRVVQLALAVKESSSTQRMVMV